MNRWYNKNTDKRAVIMMSTECGEDGFSCLVGGTVENVYNLLRNSFDHDADFFTVCRDACMAKMNDDIKEMESHVCEELNAKKNANMSPEEFIAKIQGKEDSE